MSDNDNNTVVGYKKPPKNTQFKPGQSGNPKGRSKGCRNLKTDLLEELGGRITITENGKTKKISKQQAFIKQQCSKALSGDKNSVKTLVGLMTRFLADHQEDINEKDEVLLDEDAAILDFYARRK